MPRMLTDGTIDLEGQQGISVVPVYIQHATMPRADETLDLEGQKNNEVAPDVLGNAAPCARPGVPGDIISNRRDVSVAAKDKKKENQAKSMKHLGGSRQYWRDIMLGVNDGLVSTFLLVAGVAGGGLSSLQILLTAIAGALAGAVSMCAGEYVATKSQNEVLDGEVHLESMHIRYCLQEEMNELRDLFTLIGIDDDTSELQTSLCEFYESNPEALLKIMTVLEFGILSGEKRKPILAGLTSCMLFTLGSLPSVLPFAFSGDKPMNGLIAAGSVTTASLLTVGVIKAWATRGNWVWASVENLIIAGCGGALAYSVGLLVGILVH